MDTRTCPELEHRKALKKHLRGLHPHLKKRQAKIKLAAAVDSGPFGFFRAYVPYFYDLLRRKWSDPVFPDFHGMEVIEGWCVGDAHPENFGIIYCQPEGRKSSMIFTMNDPDDGGPGPLLADVLRFLTAIRLLGQGISLEPIVNAYRQGLEGDTGFSPIVKREKALARRNRKRPERLFRRGKKGAIKPTDKVKKRFRFGKNIPPKIAKSLRKGIRALVGKDYRICGIWSLRKRGGGSGGLRRYWVLLAPRKHKSVCAKAYHKKALVLDIKTLARPGIYPLQCPHDDHPQSLACSDAPELVMNRVGETLDLERHLNISRFGDVVRFNNLPPMIVRTRWKGNRSVELDSHRFSRRELAQLLKDEAKCIGQIHHRSLPSGSHYPGHIYVISSALIEAARQMDVLYRKVFQLVK